MIKNKQLKSRLSILLFLVVSNPIVFFLMQQIASIQRQTFAYFIYGSNYLEQYINFKLDVLLVVAIAQLFWPLLIALPLNYWIQSRTKFPNHPYIYLCFFWIIFNGSFILLR